MIKKKISLPIVNFKLQFWLIFVLGGVFQVLGVVSKTKLTIILAGLTLVCIFVDTLRHARLRQPSIYAAALPALAVTILSWLVNQAPPRCAFSIPC